MNRKTFFLAVLVLGAQAREAGAQGFIIPELGSRVNGMGAAIGRPDELAAIYQNPAALALLPGTQLALSVGTAILSTDVRLAPWDQSDKFISDPVVGGYYPRQSPTVVAPVPFLGVSTKLWSDKVSGAIGIYVPNAAGASFGENAPSRYHIIDAYLFSAFFTAAVAYRPWSWLAVGLSGSAVWVRVHKRQQLWPVIGGQDVSGLIGKATELELDGEDVQPAFGLGIQAWPHRTVSLGFMMLSRHDVTLEGPLRLKLSPDAALPPDPSLTENRHRTRAVAPWVFAFGANWDITPWLEVGAELRFYKTSDYKDQVTVIEARGPDGSQKVLPTLLPPVDPSNPTGDRGLVTPKNLRDTVHTGGGFLVRPPLGKVNIEFLTGMHYENSSSPDNTVEVSAPSFELAAIHAGARWRITERFRVALFYAYYWYLERTTTDSITSPPTNFTGSGHTNMLTVVLEGRVGPGIGVR